MTDAMTKISSASEITPVLLRTCTL